MSSFFVHLKKMDSIFRLNIGGSLVTILNLFNDYLALVFFFQLWR